VEQVKLAAKPRTEIGGRSVKRLRRQGQIPAVVYGREFGEPLAVSIATRDLRNALQGHGIHSVFNLEIEGRGSTPVLVQDRQVDVVSRQLLHMDLHAINLNEEVESTVNLVITGSAPGVKEGGILDIVLREIGVKCLPANIPENITVDVSNLQIGDSIHLRDLTAPEGVTLLGDADDMVASLLPPSKAEEEVVAPEAAAVAAEPELIGAKKPEEEAAE
jgi:large subunit ribosomal protein L25